MCVCVCDCVSVCACVSVCRSGAACSARVAFPASRSCGVGSPCSAHASVPAESRPGDRGGTERLRSFFLILGPSDCVGKEGRREKGGWGRGRGGGRK